ncbi:hypothetical protein SELMODRAFT_416466 [Selaginella moellendorffii]|uniref:Uncharacterized protein n=1 Tax=Selaginella moellendorffii TaxID=88036 RepID=D8RZD3_SELML|nr:actin-fragmin kinase [Selaginella moellendorffii]EFJ22723.1 hypothetical protein SELMODRAFT_416466 [Selaginella moellendorffii]|eukprot:XP_002976463.1 actin-fragmin kinase [Selaginella moellendorffii]
MKWVRSAEGDFKGAAPSPRSGHTATRIRKTHVVVFGGLVDKKFLQDLTVLDTENNVWFQPECSGSGSDGVAGPCPRAFHVAIAMDCNLFVFGGRCGRKRLGDFWVLDTDTWQWSELTGFGELPCARDFAAGASVGNGKIVIYGGWDGSKWLSDVFVLDTMSLEWRQLPVVGPSPPPRCGHTATMVEKRLLVFGGRGGGGPVLGDLWALKGLFDEEREPAAWTLLKLPGSAPAPRCGHTTTSGGPQLLVFGGHGTAGWLTRYDIYHNDCIVLDRASVQWKRLSVTNEPPPARAYHSLTQIGSRFLLFGGFDGKSTFGDTWWLVLEDDPISSRVSSPLVATLPDVGSDNNARDEEQLVSPFNILRSRIGLPPAKPAVHESIKTEGALNDLAQAIDPHGRSTLESLREHWRKCDARSIRFKELDILLRDYQWLIATEEKEGKRSGGVEKIKVHRFYHLQTSNQVRIDDIGPLLMEYKQLLDTRV